MGSQSSREEGAAPVDAPEDPPIAEDDYLSCDEGEDSDWAPADAQFVSPNRGLPGVASRSAGTQADSTKSRSAATQAPTALSLDGSPESRARGSVGGDTPTPSPGRWRKASLRIDVEAAADGKAGKAAPPSLKEDLPFAASDPQDSPADTTPCFFSPVPVLAGSRKKNGSAAISMDQLEQALLGYSPQTSAIRSMKNADASSSRPTSGPDSGSKRGTPRDARVLGNFGFKRAQPLAASPPVTERVIVIL
jgi:hypothetical protein